MEQIESLKADEEARLVFSPTLLDALTPLTYDRYLTETKLTGRESVGVGLRLAYCVARVCNADARDHRRVAKDDRRAGQAVEESNAGAKKNRRDVDVDFVETFRHRRAPDTRSVETHPPDQLRWPCAASCGPPTLMFSADSAFS
jgi:hypothetical protein